MTGLQWVKYDVGIESAESDECRLWDSRMFGLDTKIHQSVDGAWQPSITQTTNHGQLTVNWRLTITQSAQQSRLHVWYYLNKFTQQIVSTIFPPAHHSHPSSHIHCFIQDSKLAFSTNPFHYSLLAPIVYSAFHPSGVGKWVPAAAGKAKAGMAHSDCGWMCGCAGKTVKSLENTCHTWALLRWWFTTKRRCIKWMHRKRMHLTCIAFSDYTGPDLFCSTFFSFLVIFSFFLFYVVR